ncbi:hemolysin family protein [Haloparvum sedimenti]|uniref:hemolysin family protein n=1 Tax=Haloparvum sedimenti TaxID=1678448 RepID=UPI00071E7609|nr:hemolysin family protein [Haloparvum sedimenti]
MSLTVSLLGIAAIVLLTAISAFFSSSELAVFSVAKHRLDAVVAADVPGAAALAALRADPHRFLVTVLVSNNVANIAAASVATAVLVQYLPASQAATGSTVVTSFFVIVFGEIAPKSYAVANAERHALRVARPIRVIQRLIRPVLFVFEVTTAAVNRLTGGEGEIESYVTREEIETLVISGQDAGALDATEGAMIRGVLDLEEMTVRGIMVPRTDMVAAPVDASLDEVIDAGAREGVTRLPVYGENRDDVVGIADIRDALTAREEGANLESVLREPRFVPETKPVDELLAEMRATGAGLVLAVDEFGAVTGLVTLEDVLEEVVGEIVGRGETQAVRVAGDGAAVVRGWATVGHVNETLGTDLPVEAGFETVAGLIHHHLGRIAEAGARVELADATLEVVEASGTRIKRVRVIRNDEAIAGAESGEGEAGV